MFSVYNVTETKKVLHNIQEWCQIILKNSYKHQIVNNIQYAFQV